MILANSTSGQVKMGSSIASKRSKFASFITGEDTVSDRVDIIKPYGIDLHDDKIYVIDTTGVLRAVCPKGGGILWSFRLDGKSGSWPRFEEGHLYVATEAGSIYCFKE